ncbi:MAG TPA: HPF/RaiA family ribosome-associated protein [Candidatus Paceibacterota bacterium]|jgi:ribosome-associated translation inhibitor RaiA|nr:HPF/RaiA family ribosome-associated protein [Candidatus Paceibacterota bacterium]
MEIYFKNTHQDVPGQLLARAEKRIEKLGKLIDEGRFEAQAFMEITKATGSQHSDAAWRATINIDVRGDRFHAASVQNTPEKAADRAIDEMRSELRAHHARERRIRRKADGFWKSLLHNDFKAP